MMILTLTQPWASLVAIGAKVIETRGWSTGYRGDVCIHAAKGFPPDARYIAVQEPFRSALGITLASELPTAVIVAVARLDRCVRFNEHTAGLVRARSARGKLPRHEADFGDYTAGRFGFWFRDVRKLAEPVPCRGLQGLKYVAREVEDAVREQLRRVA